MEETLISPSQSTSEVGFFPYSIDKLEFKLPLRVSHAPPTTITKPISWGLQRVCQGKSLRISPFGDISFVKDRWSTNGRKFVCQYLGAKYTRKSKASNFFERSELELLRSQIDDPSIALNLIPFTLQRIRFLISPQMEGLQLRWNPTVIHSIEVCRDYRFAGSTEELKSLLCRAASRIEGEPIEIGEVRKSSTIPFHFKWNPQCVQPVLKGKGIVRAVKIYPKPNGMRLELQVRKLKFKPQQYASDPVEEMCAQLSASTKTMVNYLERIEKEMMFLEQARMDSEFADLREAVGLYLDIESERGKEFFTSVSGPSQAYTNGRRPAALHSSEFKRLSDVSFGICFVKSGMPGFPNSLILRGDWPSQAEKMKANLAKQTEKRRFAQVEARKRREQVTTSVWERPISRRQFLTGGFLRRFHG